MRRAEIVEAARRYRGVPWHHQGRSRHGMDCVGLLVMVARDLGIPHVDDVRYSIRPRRERLNASLRASGLVETDEPRLPGDVVSMLCPRTRVPYHVGVISSRNGIETLIHSMREPGFVEEVTFAGRWAELHAGTWRYPGVPD